ncbi:MAG: restriction endonuclease [Nitrospinae bacterium]|nr:restriction endonuclease [Nitrospinota bacterium]
MPIPDYQSIMLPLLQSVSDGKEYPLPELVRALSGTFNLSEGETEELLPSGRQRTFANRVGWAKTYLYKAGLLECPKRSIIKISGRGMEVFKKSPASIDVKFLEQFPEFITFRTKRRTNDKSVEESPENSHKTPDELLGDAYQQIREGLANELLSKVKTSSPAFFESLVVDLLVKMGYGGSIEDAGKVIGKSGDGGIDGLIKEDRLGLDIIYLQAKRWEAVVGRPEIQKFAGALQGNRAKKGVFITTSTFSKEALDFVSNIDSKIVLVDGEQLAELMIDHDLGVSKVISYDIKRLDSDYFSDE